MKRLEWDNLHVLLAVVRSGNLKRAAQRLRLSTATLSRRLDALEEQLGGQLLERTSTGCFPTAFGQRIAGWAEQMEGAANEILREADSPETVEGTVRVNADEWLSFLVTALLAPIRTRYPQLDMEILTTPFPVNLARREADLSLRYTRPESSDLIAEPLGEIEFALYASSPYAAQKRQALTERNWAALDFVGLDESRMDQTMEAWWERLDGAPAPWLRCNHTLGIYDGVIAGGGVGIVEKRTARLTPSLELVMDVPELSREVWLCTHRSMRESARIKSVRDFLVETWPHQEAVPLCGNPFAPLSTLSATKACPVVLLPGQPPRILLFRHPQAGVQLVKGSIEPGETPAQAALRELKEESGIGNARVVTDLGTWDAGHQGQVWSFHLCEAGAPLPEQWSHQTEDDHGHRFSFFWAALDELPWEECHPLFQRALHFLLDGRLDSTPR